MQLLPADNQLKYLATTRTQLAFADHKYRKLVCIIFYKKLKCDNNSLLYFGGYMPDYSWLGAVTSLVTSLVSLAQHKDYSGGSKKTSVKATIYVFESNLCFGPSLGVFSRCLSVKQDSILTVSFSFSRTKSHTVFPPYLSLVVDVGSLHDKVFDTVIVAAVRCHHQRCRSILENQKKKHGNN